MSPHLNLVCPTKNTKIFDEHRWLWVHALNESNRHEGCRCWMIVTRTLHPFELLLQLCSEPCQAFSTGNKYSSIIGPVLYDVCASCVKVTHSPETSDYFSRHWPWAVRSWWRSLCWAGRRWNMRWWETWPITASPSVTWRTSTHWAFTQVLKILCTLMRPHEDILLFCGPV